MIGVGGGGITAGNDGGLRSFFVQFRMVCRDVLKIILSLEGCELIESSLRTLDAQRLSYLVDFDL